jgi:hypothetical protein
MRSYIAHHSNLNSFNYEKYLDEVSFANIHRLERDRQIANRRGLGDYFLYHLSDTFIRKYPPRMKYIEKTISIGERFLNFGSRRVRGNEIYRIIGFYILSKCAREIEQYIAKNSNPLSFFKNDDRIQKLRQRLKKSRIHIKVKKSSMNKLIDNIKQGNFAYIGDRVKKVFAEDSATKSRIKLKVFKRGGRVDTNVFYLTIDGSIIGEIIWLERPKYKAHYIAKGNVYSKYRRFLRLNHKRVRVVMTGGFTNSYQQPEGLTIEEGKVVNAVLMPDRDGLVIVQRNGGIRVINLKDKNGFLLPNGGGKINPLNSIIDYAKLLKWSKSNRATLFQTQLLAFSDKILIDRRVAKNTSRERRLLALASNKKSGKVFHLVVNVRKGVSLASITEKTFDILKKRKYKVEAILNLDVGSFNIMEVYTLRGALMLKAPVSIHKATNLLFYTD